MCNLTHDFVKAQMGPLRENMGEYFELAHYHNLMRMLPIHWDGPIALAAATAASSSALAHYFLETALGCAHCICRYCCQWLCFGLLYFWEALPMHSDGPIASADAAANYFTLAHYISGRHCQCTQMGLLHWQMLLPITSIGPIRFLGGTADALGWPHCIGRCCCQLLHFGPLYFWKVLLMHSDGPIEFGKAASSDIALASVVAG